MQPGSSASASSYHAQDPPPRSDLVWDRIPSLKIVRPPKGPFSPQVDERCFTFCSQSITGRIHGNDPWCRTICFRRVFAHEVTRVLSHHRSQTAKQSQGRKQVETKEVPETAPVNHPLPPEGQRYSGWLSMLLQERFGDLDDETHDADHLHQPHPTEMKYWQEGWYLWWSTSRWAAQEKLDLMRRDLQGQTDWQGFKDKKNEEWAKGAPPFEDQAQGHLDGHTEPHPFEDLGNMQPFPDVSASSILLPLPILPTSIPSIMTSIRPALAPTERVLALVHESISSGAQRELMGKMWEKAQTDEPRKLLVVAWGRVRETLWGGSSSEGEGRERSHGDGGKDEKR